MNKEMLSLIEQLENAHSLTQAQYRYLIDHRSPESAERLAGSAVRVRREIYGNDIYIRGLIEISSICRNDCYYCGIRCGNRNCARYRLLPEEILACAREGYRLGFRTFVMQGGEDPYYTDELLCNLIGKLKELYPDCAVTLSLGERGKESFRRLFNAGADRYLLRHETADEVHYRKLHPPQMSFENRMRCLMDLKEIGFQTGAGFMVGSPYQTSEQLAKDLKLIEQLRPQMCGIGPFIPHHDTPFRDEPAGTAELTCYLLSIIRLILPSVLLPSTTALATIHPKGHEMGILSGANVVMPNLSPTDVRGKYSLYDGKKSSSAEAAQGLELLKKQMQSIGYNIVIQRGDFKNVCL